MRLENATASSHQIHLHISKKSNHRSLDSQDNNYSPPVPAKCNALPVTKELTTRDLELLPLLLNLIYDFCRTAQYIMQVGTFAPGFSIYLCLSRAPGQRHRSKDTSNRFVQHIILVRYFRLHTCWRILRQCSARIRHYQSCDPTKWNSRSTREWQAHRWGCLHPNLCNCAFPSRYRKWDEQRLPHAVQPYVKGVWHRRSRTRRVLQFHILNHRVWFISSPPRRQCLGPVGVPQAYLSFVDDFCLSTLISSAAQPAEIYGTVSKV